MKTKPGNCNSYWNKMEAYSNKPWTSVFFKKQQQQPFFVSQLCGLTAMTQGVINTELNPVTNCSKFCASAEVEPVVGSNTIKCLCYSIISLGACYLVCSLPKEQWFLFQLSSWQWGRKQLLVNEAVGRQSVWGRLLPFTKGEWLTFLLP